LESRLLSAHLWPDVGYNQAPYKASAVIPPVTDENGYSAAHKEKKIFSLPDILTSAVGAGIAWHA
jgi:hypothetical protein